MITDLPVKRICVLSHWQTFLRVFTYNMAAEINWHRYGTKLRHCHRMLYSTALSARPSQAGSGSNWAELFCSQRIRVSPKMRTLSSGTLSPKVCS